MIKVDLGQSFRFSSVCCRVILQQGSRMYLSDAEGNGMHSTATECKFNQSNEWERVMSFYRYVVITMNFTINMSICSSLFIHNSSDKKIVASISKLQKLALEEADRDTGDAGDAGDTDNIGGTLTG